MFEKAGVEKPENSNIESEPNPLEQEVETIELNFSIDDFHKLRKVTEKFRKKMDVPNSLELYKKAHNFGTELAKKYGVEEVKEVALHHLLVGSSDVDLDDPMIKKVDFEGEDSIAKFIDNL